LLDPLEQATPASASKQAEREKKKREKKERERREREGRGAVVMVVLTVREGISGRTGPVSHDSAGVEVPVAPHASNEGRRAASRSMRCRRLVDIDERTVVESATFPAPKRT